MKKIDKKYAPYLSYIKKGIPYHGMQKKRLLEELEDSIESFLNENPSATMADIEEKFGTAEDIVASYLNGSPEEIHKSLSIKKRIFILVAIAIVAIVATVLIAKVIDDYEAQKFQNGYYVEVVSKNSFDEPLPPEISDHTF